jgi:hypothetical protein
LARKLGRHVSIAIILLNSVNRYRLAVGPVSLVVTTMSLSNAVRQTLIQTITDLSGRSLNSSLFLHLLHLDQATAENPNAFLNLARLFSPTYSVLLVPGNHSNAPWVGLHGALMSSPAMSSQVPAIIGNFSQASYPFKPLLPVLLPRDYPTWCTERFFPPLSRAADWDECLWQLWLETFGTIDIFAEVSLGDTRANGPSYTPSLATVGIFHSFASLFRS